MSSTGSASACGNTWPYSTAGRARSSGARGHRTAREVGTAVAAVAGREAPGSDRSKFVRLVLPASGSLRLEFEGVSLYRGYDLRSLMPEP